MEHWVIELDRSHHIRLDGYYHLVIHSPDGQRLTAQYGDEEAPGPEGHIEDTGVIIIKAKVVT